MLVPFSQNQSVGFLLLLVWIQMKKKVVQYKVIFIERVYSLASRSYPTLFFPVYILHFFPTVQKT